MQSEVIRRAIRHAIRRNQTCNQTQSDMQSDSQALLTDVPPTELPCFDRWSCGRWRRATDGACNDAADTAPWQPLHASDAVECALMTSDCVLMTSDCGGRMPCRSSPPSSSRRALANVSSAAATAATSRSASASSIRIDLGVFLGDPISETCSEIGSELPAAAPSWASP